jgi:hypothetical protein
VAALAVRKNNAAFVQLVHSPPFVALRTKFAALAKQCNEQARQVPVPAQLVGELHKYRE